MRTIKFTFIILMISLLAGCNIFVQQPVVNNALQNQPIKIGLLAPMTGDAAEYGVNVEKATRIAVDEINEKGGINNSKIEIILEDGKCNPKDSATAASKLVNVDKVKVILGGICSGETLAAAPITEAAKVILLSPSATSPDITNAGDYVFRTIPSDANAGRISAQTAIKNGLKKAAVLSENTDYAQGLRRVFKQSFSDQNGTIAEDQTYNPEETEFRTQILKIKNANPDVIYLDPQTQQKGQLILKQLKEAGVTSKLYVNEVLLGRELLAKSPADFEGIIGVEPKFDDKAGKAKQLFDKYREQYKAEPAFPYYMAANYDNVYLIADAVSKYGLDTDKIRDYLYALKDYDGAVGKLTIDENGDAIVGYSIKQIINGSLTEIGTAS